MRSPGRVVVLVHADRVVEAEDAGDAGAIASIFSNITPPGEWERRRRRRTTYRIPNPSSDPSNTFFLRLICSFHSSTAGRQHATKSCAIDTALAATVVAASSMQRYVLCVAHTMENCSQCAANGWHVSSRTMEKESRYAPMSTMLVWTTSRKVVVYVPRPSRR